MTHDALDTSWIYTYEKQKQGNMCVRSFVMSEKFSHLGPACSIRGQLVKLQAGKSQRFQLVNKELLELGPDRPDEGLQAAAGSEQQVAGGRYFLLHVAFSNL